MQSQRISIRMLALAALILAATAVAYSPVLHGSVLMDDLDHITQPSMRSLSGLLRIWFEPGATQQYYPVLHSAFWIEYHAWGDAVLGYHLANVLLHAAAACLLVAIVQALKTPGAWLAGLLFALHPVCAESVAWIAEQKNTLAMCFYLGSVLAYLHFDESRRPSVYCAALGLFGAAMLSKTASVPAPVVIALLLWWKRGRLGWRRDLKWLLPWVVVAVIAALPAYRLEKSFLVGSGSHALTPGERLSVAGHIFWFYLGKLFLPRNLAFVYPRWQTTDGIGSYGYFSAMLVLIAGLALIARGNRGPVAAVTIYVAGLFPVIGLVDIYWFNLSFVGDHLQYFACPAIIVVMAVAATRAWDRLRISLQGLRYLAAAVPMLVLGLLTWRQAALFRDPERLYRATLARNPDCWAIHYNLGDYLSAIPGREAEVLSEWKSAVRLKPDYVEAQNNLACLLAQTPGGTAQAVDHFEIALRYRPQFAEAHANLACVLAANPARSNEAIAEFETALRLQPDYPEAENGLGDLLIDVPGRLEEGIGHLQNALRLRPDFAEAHLNLRVAIARRSPKGSSQ